MVRATREVVDWLARSIGTHSLERQAQDFDGSLSATYIFAPLTVSCCAGWMNRQDCSNCTDRFYELRRRSVITVNPNPINESLPIRKSMGFTLVELVIVVLILGILGTVAAGRITYSYQDSIQVTLQANLDSIYEAVELNRTGSYPTAVDPAWFRGGKLPKHPQAGSAATSVQVQTNATVTDPKNKVLAGIYAPYWYNSGNGEVRVRVGVVGSEAETLAFYNVVNSTNATSLGNYADAAKAGAGTGGDAK